MFKFKIGQTVRCNETGLLGGIVARAEYNKFQPIYLIQDRHASSVYTGDDKNIWSHEKFIIGNK